MGVERGASDYFKQGQDIGKSSRPEPTEADKAVSDAIGHTHAQRRGNQKAWSYQP